MLYYELKKIWVKPGTRTAMLILVGILAITCYFAIHGVYYVNENGEDVYGTEAVQKLKAARKEWSGIFCCGVMPRGKSGRRFITIMRTDGSSFLNTPQRLLC